MILLSPILIGPKLTSAWRVRCVNMEPKLFVATKAFIERDGKILILREAGKYQDGTNIGHYDVPGGRLTPGENWQVALTREVKEETDLDVTVGPPFFCG